ncbi:MAG TPA: MATE family efflux transporter [Spirochaetota bacterium]
MKKMINNRIASAKKFTEDHFFKTMIFIAIPVMFQSLMSSSLNFIDSIMVGKLGDTSISAVGLANQVYFVVFLFILAVSGGSSMFISQFWGKKDLTNVRRVQGLGLILVIAVSILVIIPSVVAPEKIMSFLSPNNEVRKLGSTFLRISSLSYILYGISTVYAVTLRNTGHPRIPLIANATGVIINTSLNYVLIFGHFGFPQLGVAGSAIATCIARVIECAIIIGTVYSHSWPSSATLRQMFDMKVALIRKYFSQSGLLIAKDVVWAIGFVIYNKTYSTIGTAESAAVLMIGPIHQVAIVFFVGLATSCQIMVGNQLGADNREKAYLYAKRFLKIGFTGALFIGTAVFFMRDIILLPYNVSEHALESASTILKVYACYLPVSMFTMMSVVGILRSGGDTIFCLVMDLIAVYLIGMPLAFAGVYVWKLPIAFIYGLVLSQEIFKSVILLSRFSSRKWMRNLTHGI